MIIGIGTMCLLFWWYFKMSTRRARGTNAFTRMVRDSSATSLAKRIILVGIFSVLFATIESISERLFIGGIFPLIPLILTIKNQQKSNESEQRVKDSRYCTKVAGQIVSAGAETVGTAVGSVAGPAGAKAGKMVGAGVGGIAGITSDQMTDVQTGIDRAKLKSQINQNVYRIASQPEKIQTAQAMGIKNAEQLPPEQLDQVLLERIPQSEVAKTGNAQYAIGALVDRTKQAATV